VLPEKPDKIIMDVYEHISRLSRARLSGWIIAIDDRMTGWEKRKAKLEKQHEDASEKRQAADLKMAAFDQTIDKTVSSILASDRRLWPLQMQKLGL
jgi:hypothetical protein